MMLAILKARLAAENLSIEVDAAAADRGSECGSDFPDCLDDEIDLN